MSVTDCKDSKGEGMSPENMRKAYNCPTLKPLGQLKDVTATGSGRANEPGSNPGQGSNPNQGKRRP